MKIFDLFPSVDKRLLKEHTFLNHPWLLLVEAAYDPKVLSLKKNFPDESTEIDEQVGWAEQIFKSRDGKILPDKITWWLNLYGENLKFSQKPPVANQFKQMLGSYSFTSIEQLQTDVSHYFGYDSDAIRNSNFSNKPFSQIKTDLDALEQKFIQSQETDKPVPMMDGDRVLYDFPDGTKWIFCNRAFCKEEGRSGKHCGNVVGQHKPDQRILSLRDRIGRVILTFIYEPDGTLGEMKAKGNQRPAQKYHQHIYALLMGTKLKIKGISGEGYLPEMNFDVFDFNEETLATIYKKKPILIKTQLSVTPIDFMNAPEWIRKDAKLRKTALSKLPGLATLVNEAGNVTSDLNMWEKAIKHDPKLILNAPPQLKNYKERVVDCVTQSYEDNYDCRRLMTAPAALRKDYDFLRLVLDENITAIKYIQENTPRYSELALYAVEHDFTGNTLEHVSTKAQNYEQICLAAVKKGPYAIRYVPPTLPIYDSLCLLAVKGEGTALGHIPKQYRTDEICLAAITGYSDAARFVAPPQLRRLIDQHSLNHLRRYI